MKRVLLVCLLSILALTACQTGVQLGSMAAPVAAPTSVVKGSPQLADAFDPSKVGGSEKDITYCRVDGMDLKMDVYYPDRYDASPWPVVMFVHGGAWQKGDKSEGSGSRSLPWLRASGFLVVAVNYRLSPQYPFPAQIEDVKCALRSLRARSDFFHLDPQRIGVLGGSAGGHLVALLGTAGETTAWDVGEYPDQSSRVQAVVDMFGPADLSVEFDSSNFQTARAVFGAASASDPKLVAASPVSYVDGTDAPFLILHGDMDAVVPLEQSRILFQALQQAGVESSLVVVQGAGHGFVRAGSKAIVPGLQVLYRQVVDFFIQHLKK
jgi:acetyl esterase/lipase